MKISGRLTLAADRLHGSRFARLALHLSFVAILLQGNMSAATVYKLIDLGTLGGVTSDATAINDNGTAVGYSTFSGGANHAFIWTIGGGIQDLTPTSGSSQAFDINNNDNVVGITDAQAFRWKNSTGTVLIDSSNLGRANDVNNNDEAIGFRSAGGANRTFEWSATNSITNPYPTANTQGIANNDLGQYVGIFNGTTGFYSAGGTAARQLTPTGFLPTDINNAREITGSLAGIATLYDFDTSTSTTVGKLSPSDSSSNALGINEAGTVVGISVGSGGFIYDNTLGGLMNLTALLSAQDAGWTILTAEDINNVGQIVGQGRFNGVDHAVILTPVPEPTAITFLAICCAGFGLRRFSGPRCRG